MAQRNRVTPTGEIEALDVRCAWLGNRGSIHRGHEVVRAWKLKAWITCTLEHTDAKGNTWQLPQWEPHRFTVLFFYDEAVSLAAGHRPCALCRRADYNRFAGAWAAAFDLPSRARAPEMDVRMHADRLDRRVQRTHHRPWAQLPAGAFVLTDDGSSARVDDDALVPWLAAGGYSPPRPRPTRGIATVLTPACTVDVLRAGYQV